jgi:hypothetical protein
VRRISVVYRHILDYLNMRRGGECITRTAAGQRSASQVFSFRRESAG